MKQVRTILTANQNYYWASFIGMLFCSILLLTTSKAQSFISLNSFHSFGLNVFFVNYTFLGDGIFALGFCAFLFYRKQKKLALLILAAYLSSGLVTQVLKNLIYAPRPRIYFEASQYLFHLDNFGNSGGGASSFPSGHTTSAFAMATVLAIYSQKKYISFLLLIAATLVGYSRIYLAQHFPADVVMGAFIGTSMATISCAVAASKISFQLPKKAKRPAVSQWNNQQLPHTAIY